MDNLVRTSDSTGTHCQRTRWPTTGPARWHTEARKIGKTERTPMAHRSHAVPRTGIAIG